MNFGVRLPGPFRVGMSSKGRVSVGMTLGPFSVSSGGTSSARRPARPDEAFYPIDLDGAVAELAAVGWTEVGRDHRSAILRKGWKAAQIDAVDGGVTWRQVTSRRTVATWTVVALALIVALLVAAG